MSVVSEELVLGIDLNANSNLCGVYEILKKIKKTRLDIFQKDRKKTGFVNKYRKPMSVYKSD